MSPEGQGGLYWNPLVETAIRLLQSVFRQGCAPLLLVMTPYSLWIKLSRGAWVRILVKVFSQDMRYVMVAWKGNELYLEPCVVGPKRWFMNSADYYQSSPGMVYCPWDTCRRRNYKVSFESSATPTPSQFHLIGFSTSQPMLFFL